MKDAKMSVKNRIPERAAMFVNMKTVLSRVEKRGQLETLLKAITDTRDQEEAELGQELLGDPQEVDTYSRVFKENFKVLLGILADEVWAQAAVAVSGSSTASNGAHAYSNISTQIRSDELSQSKGPTAVVQDPVTAPPPIAPDTAEQPQCAAPDEDLDRANTCEAAEMKEEPSVSVNANVKPSEPAPHRRSAREIVQESAKRSQPAPLDAPKRIVAEINRIKAQTQSHPQTRPSEPRATQQQQYQRSAMALTSRTRSPSDKFGLNLSQSNSKFRSAREKTEFYNSLVQSEFSSVQGAATFCKEKRNTTLGDMPESPGPAKYRNEVPTKSPGGTIGRGRRMPLINEKETSNSPGPHDYCPRYRFVTRHCY